MIRQCAAVSTVLLVASLVARLVAETGETSVVGAGRRLIERALHWHDVGDGERDPLLQYQHYTTALAFLQAARELASDTDLERTSGLDVSRTWNALETSRRVARRRVKGE